jgi:hypothetical protein
MVMQATGWLIVVGPSLKQDGGGRRPRARAVIPYPTYSGRQQGLVCGRCKMQTMTRADGRDGWVEQREAETVKGLWSTDYSYAEMGSCRGLELLRAGILELAGGVFSGGEDGRWMYKTMRWMVDGGAVILCM